MTYPLANEANRYRELRSRLIAAFPDLVDDEDCLLDTLEGLTDIKERLAGLIRSALQDEADANGTKEYIKKLSDREAAKRERARKKKAIALNFISDLGLRSIAAPDLTASVRRVPPGVSIYDESQIPKDFLRVKTEPDKTAIKLALKEGKQVPGCQLGNSSETLAIKI